MLCYVTAEKMRRRVFVRAAGQWTRAEAQQFYTEMHAVLTWARIDGRPITILADLDGLILHTADVSRRIEEAVGLMRQFPIERYALIVPSYLMRMQCRRLLDGIDHTFFDNRAAAADWLGWEAGYTVAA